MKPNPAIVGYDFGGVICNRVGPDGVMVENFNDHYQDCKPTEGILHAICNIIAHFNRENPDSTHYIVSSVSSLDTENASRNWLAEYQFYTNTGLEENHVLFCRGRELKAGICRELGITHFVDDRPSVLKHLIGIVPELYLFCPRQAEMDEHPDVLPHVHIIQSAQHLQDLVLADWNIHHESSFTTEIIGYEPKGIVCRDETLATAAVKAYNFVLKTKLSLFDIAHLPELMEIWDYCTAPRNILKLKLKRDTKSTKTADNRLM